MIEFFCKNCSQLFCRRKTLTSMFRRVLNAPLYLQYKCIEAALQGCSEEKIFLKICYEFTGEHSC